VIGAADRSDRRSALDGQAVISRGYKHDPGFMKLIATTPPAEQIDVAG